MTDSYPSSETVCAESVALEPIGSEIRLVCLECGPEVTWTHTLERETLGEAMEAWTGHHRREHDYRPTQVIQAFRVLTGEDR